MLFFLNSIKVDCGNEDSSSAELQDEVQS